MNYDAWKLDNGNFENDDRCDWCHTVVIPGDDIIEEIEGEHVCEGCAQEYEDSKIA